MKACYIFAAGDLCGPMPRPDTDDLILAADAGLVSLQKLGLVPDLLIGDLDSMPQGMALPDQANIVSPIKDDTDTMLAVRHALKQGCDQFFLYGCTGGDRFEHTVANLQTLAFISQNGGKAMMYEKNAELSVLTNGSMTFSQGRGYISMFAIGGDAHGVCETGMKYTLDHAVLPACLALGVSNELISPHAVLTVEDGTIIIIRQVDKKEKERNQWL